MNILIKHIIRLKNTVLRHMRMISLKMQYGSQIKLQKFHFRDNFHVYIEDEGILEIGKNCFFASLPIVFSNVLIKYIRFSGLLLPIL